MKLCQQIPEKVLIQLNMIQNEIIILMRNKPLNMVWLIKYWNHQKKNRQS